MNRGLELSLCFRECDSLGEFDLYDFLLFKEFWTIPVRGGKDVSLRKHAVASHFGVYIADHLDPKREANWQELSLSNVHLHPVLRPVVQELCNVRMDAALAARFMVVILSTRYVKPTNIGLLMQEVWQVLINDESTKPLFTYADKEMFSNNFGGPSLDSFNSELVWQLALKVDRMLTSEVGHFRSLIQTMKQEYESWFSRMPRPDTVAEPGTVDGKGIEQGTNTALGYSTLMAGNVQSLGKDEDQSLQQIKGLDGWLDKWKTGGEQLITSTPAIVSQPATNHVDSKFEGNSVGPGGT